MKRILLVMEQGGGLGHAAHAAALAAILQARGHEVVVAGPPRELAAKSLAGVPYRLVPGPVCQLPPAPRPNFSWASLATVFWDLGLSRPDLTPALFDAWRATYRDVKPDAILFDAAPFARLAAIGLGIPRIEVGVPYGIVPPVSPLPSFKFWSRVPRSEAVPFEARLQAAITKGLGIPDSYSCLGQLLDGDAALISSVPELDPYPCVGRLYPGPVAPPSSGLPVEWTGAGRTAFAYLRAASADIGSIAHALGSHFEDVVVACADAPQQVIDRFEGTHVRVFREFLDVRAIARTANLIVSHAGSLMAIGVTHGIAQVALPTQFEQLVSAQLLARAGLGLMALPAHPSACTAAIRTCAHPSWPRAALESARSRHADMSADPSANWMRALDTVLG